MGYEHCAENQKRSLEKRRELMARDDQSSIQRLVKPTKDLHNLDAADHYRKTNRDRSKHHRRAAIVP